MNILKTMKVLTLNGWIIWFVNDVSIMLLRTKQVHPGPSRRKLLWRKQSRMRGCSDFGREGSAFRWSCQEIPIWRGGTSAKMDSSEGMSTVSVWGTSGRAPGGRGPMAGVCGGQREHGKWVRGWHGSRPPQPASADDRGRRRGTEQPAWRPRGESPQQTWRSVCERSAPAAVPMGAGLRPLLPHWISSPSDLIVRCTNWVISLWAYVPRREVAKPSQRKWGERLSCNV